MTADTTQHVIATLIQSRGLEERAQRMRADAARMFRTLNLQERHQVTKQSGFSFETLELIAASLR